jgi:hypothetical protein
MEKITLSGFYEMNIRVGSGGEEDLKKPFAVLIADPIV